LPKRRRTSPASSDLGERLDPFPPTDKEVTPGLPLEPHFNLVECFDPATNRCSILPACGLSHALVEARDAFLAVLDRYTLADLIPDPHAFVQFLQAP
jgi:Rrf2 family transcriptional regulator, nitric oxide-sensitive transcriptional repressor